MLTLLAAIATGLTVTVLVASLVPRPRPLDLARLGRQPGAAALGEERQPSLQERVIWPLLDWLERQIRWLMPGQIVRDIDRSLERAGRPVSVGVFLMQWGVSIAVPPLLLTTLGLAAGLSPLVSVFLGVLAAPLGFFGPLMWLRGRIARRQQRILKDLPDALDLIAVSVAAGLGLEAALSKVSERLPGPLSEELARALQEIAVGRPRHEALLDLTERANVEELRTFITALVQAEQLGIGISQVLRTQADYLRMRRRQRAELAVQQAPVKMLFPLIFLIFPAMMVVILGPAVLILWDALIQRRP
jgi:tight adherence protein C